MTGLVQRKVGASLQELLVAQLWEQMGAPFWNAIEVAPSWEQLGADLCSLLLAEDTVAVFHATPFPL
jgi:hypothetical protein